MQFVTNGRCDVQCGVTMQEHQFFIGGASVLDWNNRVIFSVQQVQSRQFGCFFGKLCKSSGKCQYSSNAAIMECAQFQRQGRPLRKTCKRCIRLQNIEAMLGILHQNMQ